MSSLTRLIYTSRWSDEVEKDLGEIVRRIIATSIRNNRIVDVSGLLVAHEGWFIQALEGARDKLAALMDRIGADPRHKDVRVIASGPAESRAFRDWNMSVAALGPDIRPLLVELGLAGRFDGSRLDEASALTLMLAAAESERKHERQQALRLA